MDYGYPGAFKTLWEDFLTDNVTEWLETVGSSATQNIRDLHGGWWRQESDGNNADDLILAAEVVWEVDEGGTLVMEARLQNDQVADGTNTGSAIFFGLNDANTEASGIMPIHEESGSQTVTATDCVGFLLDESAAQVQDATWKAASVENTAGNTSVALIAGADQVAAVIQVLRLVLNANDSGTARYYIGTADQFGGGVLVSTQTGWFRSSIQYCPFIGTMDRGDDADTDWDYIYVSCART